MANEPLYRIMINVYDHKNKNKGIRENPSHKTKYFNQIIEFNINTGAERSSKDARERESLNIYLDQIKINEQIANKHEINICVYASDTNSHQFILIFNLILQAYV